MFTATGKNIMLDALGVTHVSAHSADPTDAGLNEISGGSYARQSITYSAASGGVKDSSNVPAISIPSGNTVAYFGFWSALTGGTFLGYSALDAPEVYANDGTITVTDQDLIITDP